ncbi:hypothetical protein GF407_15540 [candidate division KSB1 bacterium]|nr:hypothetical protein [candidate division KSB1 bacterium]
MHPVVAKYIVYRTIETCRGEKVSATLDRIRKIPFLPPGEIKKLQREKLTRILQNAEKNIPYYRQTFKAHGIQVERLDLPQDLTKLPILSKETIRERPREFIDPTNKSRTSEEVTSGTSGRPLVVIKDRQKSACIRAVMFRCYEHYGVTIGNKQVRFWGIPAKRRDRRREQLKDILANRIRISAFDLNNRCMPGYLEEIRKFKPDYFYGYPCVLKQFSEWIQEKNLSLDGIHPRVIITTGEILYPLQREIIAKTFQCPVANEYGTTENGVVAFECCCGNMHIMADHLYVESIPLSHSNGSGKLLITELNNFYNPLIRYDIGDTGMLSDKPCKCGIRFPILTALQGRDSSFIITPENTHVNDGILEYILRKGVVKFQGFQRDKNHLHIKIVKNDDLTAELMQEYKRELHRHLGERIKIEFKFVREIAREPSGKFRYFITELI